MIAEKINFVDSAEIVKTAKMLFQTQGFDNTTVKDIVIRIDITEALFYRHFGSVDEILELLWSGTVRY